MEAFNRESVNQLRASTQSLHQSDAAQPPRTTLDPLASVQGVSNARSDAGPSAGASGGISHNVAPEVAMSGIHQACAQGRGQYGNTRGGADMEDAEVVSDGDSAEGPMAPPPPRAGSQQRVQPNPFDDSDSDGGGVSAPPHGPSTAATRPQYSDSEDEDEEIEFDRKRGCALQNLEMAVVGFLSKRKMANLKQIKHRSTDKGWPKDVDIYRFVTARPHLFAPELVCASQQKEFDHALLLLKINLLDYMAKEFDRALLVLKLNLLDYMAVKRQPRIDITALVLSDVIQSQGAYVFA
eukprot:gene13561-19432_t